MRARSAILMAGLLAACSSGSSSKVAGPTASTLTTTTVPTPTTLTTATPTTVATTSTFPQAPTVPGATTCTGTQACAQMFFADWEAGDRTAASRIATPEAVAKMFGHTYAPLATSSGPQDPWHFNNCQGAAGHTYCTWQAQDQELDLSVSNGTGSPGVEVDGVRWFEGSPLREVP